jgi:uncharacterized protein YhhL (DUF1145 family)
MIILYTSSTPVTLICLISQTFRHKTASRADGLVFSLHRPFRLATTMPRVLLLHTLQLLMPSSQWARPQTVAQCQTLVRQSCGRPQSDLPTSFPQCQCQSAHSTSAKTRRVVELITVTIVVIVVAMMHFIVVVVCTGMTKETVERRWNGMR